MQEGFHWDTDDSIKNISSQGVFLQDAKKLTVWGDIDRNLAVNKAKILSSQIEIIGSPRYDNLFHSKLKNSDYILLASSGDPQPEEIEGLRTNKIEKYLDDVFKISKIVFPLIFNNPLGNFSVCSPSLVPFPAAIIIAFI